MRRFAIPLLALIAILFSNVLMLPDVHAAQGESFAHAADHVYAHGAEHFDAGDRNTDEGDQEQPAAHHNCSFNFADDGAVDLSAPWQKADLSGPSAASPLASLAPPVLTQPPKA